MRSVTISRTAVDTERAGEGFAKQLKPQDVVFLIGNLGAGKTTFVKGLAKGLGITSRIISPTFVIVREHSIPTSRIRSLDGKLSTMYHLDLYRLQTQQEAKAIDLKDYLEDTKAIVVIEWPELSQKIVDKKVWKIRIDLQDDFREISFSYE